MSLKIAITQALLVCAGTLLVSPGRLMAQAGGSTQMDGSSAKMMKSGDTKFAMAAAQGGMAEVQLGQLAVQKATDPNVKAFGQHMVDDHTKADDQLKTVAEKDGMTLPTTLTSKDQALMSRLQNLSGAQFDRAYMKSMVKDHEEDVKEFQKEANSGQSADLKDFASQTLPVLQGHLQMAKDTDSKLK